MPRAFAFNCVSEATYAQPLDLKHILDRILPFQIMNGHQRVTGANINLLTIIEQHNVSQS